MHLDFKKSNPLFLNAGRSIGAGNYNGESEKCFPRYIGSGLLNFFKMDTKLFPESIIHSTVEVYDSKISVKSQLIYILLLFLIISLFLALPLIMIDVSIQSKGAFQSSFQRNSVLNTVNGRLEYSSISENKKVKKGDVLAVIRGDKIGIQVDRLDKRILLVKRSIDDLKKLLDSGISANFLKTNLKTNIYQTSYLKFITQIQNQELTLRKRKRDFDRGKLLFDNKSIAFVEYDELEVLYKQAEAQFDMIQKNQLNEWEQELRGFLDELNQLNSQVDIAKEELDQFKIVAGVSGSLLNVSNLNIGDFVYPNQKLAEISPDTSLMAVTYISPTDIGFIQIGQDVVFQVDAFNYNHWGILKGNVSAIGDDLTLLNESSAAYLVTCSLDSDFLKLPNGQIGKVKKGMTFNSRYVVAKRSLFQLLYDQVDDWLNPMVY